MYSNLRITSLDLSQLKKVKSIGKWFLYGCSYLESVDLFDKDPTTMTVSSDYFMQSVDEAALYTTNQWLDLYKETAPWSSKKEQIQVRQ